MKALLASLLLVAIALPAMAQVVVRRPIPLPPRYPYPSDPLPPYDQCFGQRADRVSRLTRELAIARLERFEIEKAVDCSLTSSGINFASGKCFEANGDLFARLNMSFTVRCHTRDGSSQLRKTTIKYY
jgi:hypothetical protein